MLDTTHREEVLNLIDQINQIDRDADTYWSMGNGIDAGDCYGERHKLQDKLNNLVKNKG